MIIIVKTVGSHEGSLAAAEDGREMKGGKRGGCDRFQRWSGRRQIRDRGRAGVTRGVERRMYYRLTSSRGARNITFERDRDRSSRVSHTPRRGGEGEIHHGCRPS